LNSAALSFYVAEAGSTYVLLVLFGFRAFGFSGLLLVGFMGVVASFAKAVVLLTVLFVALETFVNLVVSTFTGEGFDFFFTCLAQVSGVGEGIKGQNAKSDY